jgi:hypothetical protein
MVNDKIALCSTNQSLIEKIIPKAREIIFAIVVILAIIAYDKATLDKKIIGVYRREEKWSAGIFFN